MEFIKTAILAVKEALINTWVFKKLHALYKNPMMLILVVIVVGLAGNQLMTYYNKYLEEYKRVNAEVVKKENDTSDNLKFTKIDEFLYTMTGTVGEGDCDRIAPDMPSDFTLILESPGGNLAEGSCLAAHIKLRNVVTVVRDTKVLNADGKVIYTPGGVPEDINVEHLKGKTVCASACGLLFLGGDRRYLIGDVWFGIHGPGTPDGIPMSPKQAEAGALRTASNLLSLLESLGVEDPDVRKLFIQIPNQTMYWLHPRDFRVKPELMKIATNYVNFWELNTANLDPV